MPPTRRKALRQLAPQTIEEATELLGRYAGIITEAERLKADADQAKAAIDAARDAALAPMEQVAKGIFLQLRAWWGVAGVELTEGRRKSHELAGCLIGERTTPPSLKMPAKSEEAAAILLNAGWTDLVRTKVDVDKPAVLKILGTDAAPQIAALGFRPVQKDEFFIDRAAKKAAPVEELATEILEAAE